METKLITIQVNAEVAYIFETTYEGQRREPVQALRYFSRYYR